MSEELISEELITGILLNVKGYVYGVIEVKPGENWEKVTSIVQLITNESSFKIMLRKKNKNLLKLKRKRLKFIRRC